MRFPLKADEFSSTSNGLYGDGGREGLRLRKGMAPSPRFGKNRGLQDSETTGPGVRLSRTAVSLLKYLVQVVSHPSLSLSLNDVTFEEIEVRSLKKTEAESITRGTENSRTIGGGRSPNASF